MGRHVCEVRQVQTEREELPEVKAPILHVESPPPGNPFGNLA